MYVVLRNVCRLSKNEGEHKHDLVTVAAKPATCTESGYKEYVYCKIEGCGYTTKNEIKALGHDMEEVAEVTATCTEDGHSAYGYCKREGCGYTVEKTIYPATGHDIKFFAAKSAACEEDGYTAYRACVNEDCDYVEGKKIIEHIGHLLKQEKGDKANCMRSGYDDYEYCQRSGCSYTTKSVTKATKTEHKTVNGRCAECGFTVDDLADFFVDIESGKAPVVLQLTDPQAIDSAQDRTGRLHASEKVFTQRQTLKQTVSIILPKR